MKNKTVYDHLIEYKDRDIYPFHMPGHKRQKLDIFHGVHPFEIDYTEVDDLDDLHEPEDMFRESMDMAKAFYGTEETFYMVNGSTSGNMAAIAAVCDYGDTIIVSRNCHKSVYMAIELLNLNPVYIYPQIDQENGMVIHMNSENVEKIVDKYPKAKAIMLTSPTYEGNIMDIRTISEIANNAGMALIVDEAHGAHLPFCRNFSNGKLVSAIDAGADLVIQSLHKTMPALTQTALLHVCSKNVDIERVKDGIRYFTTTSPSYLFSASMDYAVRFGIENQEAFAAYCDQMTAFRERMNGQLRNLYLVNVDDPGKIVISTSKCSMTGQELYDILLKSYRLQMEMSQEFYVLAMTSICDTRDGLDRLERALLEIDQMVKLEKKSCKHWMIENEQVCTPYEAKRKVFALKALEECADEISCEYVYLYPPGIPLIVPGERINAECVEKVLEYEREHLRVKGFQHQKENLLKVVRESDSRN